MDNVNIQDLDEGIYLVQSYTILDNINTYIIYASINDIVVSFKADCILKRFIDKYNPTEKFEIIVSSRLVPETNKKFISLHNPPSDFWNSSCDSKNMVILKSKST